MAHYQENACLGMLYQQANCQVPDWASFGEAYLTTADMHQLDILCFTAMLKM